MPPAALPARSLLALSVLVSPVFAQIDLSGEWAGTFYEDLQHRGGVRLGDYTGLPYNEAGWRKGHSWDEAARSTYERQCIPHVATYALRGPATIRLTKIADPITGELQAYSLVGSYGRPRTIWMDGREHPSGLAPHTWAGFSTGAWERNTLVVTTTHIKTGWLLRNGAPTSDLATMREHFNRYGDYLMVTTFIDDPIFLEEPFIRTTNFVLSLPSNANSWGNCGPAQIADELGGRPKGSVPHYLPGDVAHVEEFLKSSGVPAEAARGGAATTYPEYMVKLKNPSQLDNRVFPPPLPGKTIARAAPVAAAKDVEVFPVQGNVYMIAGAGGNIAAQIGEDGILLVDSGSGDANDKVIAALRKLSNKPIRIILNTHVHPDHMGGNEQLAKAGSLGGGGRADERPRPGALVLAHEAVLTEVSSPDRKPPVPQAAWPTEGYPGEWKEVFSNGEAIQLMHAPAAHTDGDSLIFFRRSDVIATGDVFDTNSYPVIDTARGGTIHGVVAALNKIIDITIPKDWQEGGTMVIPGHGRICDEADVVEYRDTITIIRDRIEDMIKKGMTLEQVKAARPTLEYDARYGSETGPWTTTMFIEAAYKTLSRKQ
jgi:cyclase